MSVAIIDTGDERITAKKLQTFIRHIQGYFASVQVNNDNDMI